MNDTKNLPEVLEVMSVEVKDKSPMELAQSFLTSGGNLENLEKMLSLQERFDTTQAKKAYTVAMSKFKSTPLLISKDKVNGQFKSKYVSIGNLVNSALPGMGACGLSHKWEIDQSDIKNIKVTCMVTHSAGHSESVSMIAPPDTSGGASKNPIQQIKSTITYLRAATFEGVMGLASTDANFDDDGNQSSSIKYITENQLSQIVDMIAATESDEVLFLKFMGIESIKLMPVNLFNKAIASLKAKVKK